MSATDDEFKAVKRGFPAIVNEILHQMNDLSLEEMVGEKLPDIEQTVCAKFFETYTSNVHEHSIDLDSIIANIEKFKECICNNIMRLISIGLQDTKMFGYASYTSEMYEKMCKTNPYMFMTLFGTGYYPILACKDKIMYQYHPSNKEFEQVMTIGDESGSISIELTYFDGVVLLQNVSPEVVLTFIFSHNEQRYIFIPVTLSLYSKKSGHQTMLIFDNFARTFYYFDPNGQTGYFRDNNPNGETHIHETLVHYIGKELSLDYTFIPFPYFTSFNYADDNAYTYDHGHCVSISFMMVHLLKELTEKTPDMIVNELETFPAKERRQLIYNFTANMCKTAGIMLQ